MAFKLSWDAIEMSRISNQRNSAQAFLTTIKNLKLFFLLGLFAFLFLPHLTLAEITWTGMTSPSTSGFYQAAVGYDFNLDGAPDIVAISDTGAYFWWGSVNRTCPWTFCLPWYWETSAESQLISTGEFSDLDSADYNNDGKLDVAFSGSNGLEAWLFDHLTLWGPVPDWDQDGIPDEDDQADQRNTGDGTIENFVINKSAIAEEWNITCESETQVIYSAVAGNIGNGSLQDLEVYENTELKDENWTLTCTQKRIDDDPPIPAIFSVVGEYHCLPSEACTATEEEPFLHEVLTFTINPGSINFELGDKFYIHTIPAKFSVNGSITIQAPEAVINVPYNFDYFSFTIGPGEIPFAEADNFYLYFKAVNFSESSQGLPIFGSYPCLTSSDLNNDGKLDLVTTTGNQIVICYGDGQTPVHWTVQAFPKKSPFKANDFNQILALDINHDGFTDLAAASENNGIFVWLQTSLNHWSENTAPPDSAGHGYQSIAIADFNNDGKFDLAGSRSDGGIYVWYQTGSAGNGTIEWIYHAAASIPEPSNLNTGNGTMSSVEVSDNAVTEDWYVKCVEVNAEHTYFSVRGSVSGTQTNRAEVGQLYSTDNGNISFLISMGSTEFEVDDKFTFSTARGPFTTEVFRKIRTTDFDNDGKLDLVGASEYFGVLIWLGDGIFGWIPETSPSTSSTYNDVFVNLDLNWDGNPDVVASNNGGGVLVWGGDGSDRYSPIAWEDIEWVPKPVGEGTFFGVDTPDLDFDGKHDVVGAHFATGEDGIQIWLGNGLGQWQSIPSPLDVEEQYYSVLTADLNNDGLLDLIAGHKNNGIHIYLNQGIVEVGGQTTIQWGPKIIVAAGYTFWDLKVKDLNFDGNLDLAGAENISGVHIFLGNGNGTFKTPILVDDSFPAWSVSLADLNNDGFYDVVAGSWSGHGVGLWLGTSSSTWSSLSSGPTDILAFYGVDIKDLDHDGKQDIIAASDGSGIYIWYGDGSGIRWITHQVKWDVTSSEVDPCYITSQGQYRDAVLADLNNDGWFDITSANNGAGCHVWLNYPYNCSTCLLRYSECPMPSSPEQETGDYHGVSIADFSNDGLLDIAASHAISGGVGINVWFGKRDFTPPIVYRTVPSADGIYEVEQNKFIFLDLWTDLNAFDPDNRDMYYSSIDASTFRVQESSRKNDVYGGIFLWEPEQLTCPTPCFQCDCTNYPNSEPDGTGLLFLPNQQFQRGSEVTVTVKGGSEGVMDTALNTLDGNKDGIADQTSDDYEFTFMVTDLTPPAPPVGLTASSQSEQITLNWNANPEEDLGGYKIYYDSDKTGPPYEGTDAIEGASPIVIEKETEYTLTGLTNGQKYYISITAYDEKKCDAEGNCYSPGNESGYSQEINATPLGSMINGYVTDKNTSHPLQGALVFAQNYNSQYSSFTDQNGYYQLNLITGTYLFSASLSGYLSYSEMVEIPNETPVIINVELSTIPNPAVIQGVVTDASDASGIENAKLEAVDSENIHYAVFSDSEGFYTISLLAGTYSFEASADGYETQSIADQTIYEGQSINKSFSLKPLGAVQGKVIDLDTMLPIVGAKVEARSSDGAKIYLTETNQTGNYFLEVVATTYNITADADNYLPHTEYEVEINAGQTLSLNLSLQPFSILDAMIFGYVKDQASGQPIADALAFAQNLNNQFSGVTNLLGFYQIDLEPGNYQFSVSASGYLPYSKNVNITEDAPVRIDVSLTAMVQPATLQGIITDASTGLGLGNARIEAQDANNIPFETYANENGQYTLVLPPQTYNLEVSAEGYETKNQQNLILHEGDTIYLSFALEPTGFLNGRVLDGQTMTPISGALVEALLNQDKTYFTYTNPSGSYSLEVVTGSYQVTASAENYKAFTKYNINVNKGQTVNLDFTLVPTATINGTVSDQDGAIENARVFIWPENIDRFTNSEGFYEFKNLELKTYTLIIVADMHLTKTVEVTLTQAGEIKVVNISLEKVPTGTIFGSVNDDLGNPILGALIRALDELGNEFLAEFDGVRYELFLPAGFYWLKARAEGYSSSTVTDIEVIVDQQQEINFTLLPAFCGSASPITLDTNKQSKPAVWNNLICWTDNRAVESYTDYNNNDQYDGWGEGYTDLNDNGVYDEDEPYIDANNNNHYDGSGEPYQDQNYNGQYDCCLLDIYAFDIRLADSEEAEQEVTNVYSTGTFSNPEIYQKLVVCQDFRDLKWSIYLYDLTKTGNGRETPISENLPGYSSNPSIYKDWIVFENLQSGNSDIWAYPINNKNTFKRLTDNPSQQSNPQIYGNLVVWEDYRNGNADIYAYDLDTDTQFQITTNSFSQTHPAIYIDDNSKNGLKAIVWQDNRNGQWDIYAYDLTKDSDNDGLPNYREDPTHRPIPDPAEIALTSELIDQTQPKIFFDTIVFQELTQQPVPNWDIVMLTVVDLQTADVVRRLLSQDLTTIPANQINPDLYLDNLGNIIAVWEQCELNSNIGDIYFLNSISQVDLTVGTARAAAECQNPDCGNITVTLSVVDPFGLPITGLGKECFLISDNNILQEISDLSTAVESPISVGLVLDYSGSMSEESRQDAETASHAVVDDLRLDVDEAGNDDQAAVVKFADDVVIEQNFTSNKIFLHEAIDREFDNNTHGFLTAFYDAVYETITLSAAECGSRAIIALTDGEDTASSRTKEELIAYAQEEGIPIYTVGLGSFLDKETLQEIAESTGGYYYEAPSSDQLEILFTNIFRTLQSQYIITYQPGFPENGQSHAIKVTLDMDCLGCSLEATIDLSYYLACCSETPQTIVSIPDLFGRPNCDPLAVRVQAANSISSFGLKVLYDRNLLQFDSDTGILPSDLTANWILEAVEDADGLLVGGFPDQGNGGKPIDSQTCGELFQIPLQEVFPLLDGQAIEFSIPTQYLEDGLVGAAVEDGNYIVDLCLEPGIPRGDVDRSGSVTPNDALLALQIFLGIYIPLDTEACIADYDGDCLVTPSDALCILKVYLGIEDANC